MWCFVSLFLVVSTSAIDYLERFVSKMTCYVSGLTLSLTHLSPSCKCVVCYKVKCLCYMHTAHSVSWREVAVGQGRHLSSNWSSADQGGRACTEDSAEKDTEQGDDEVQQFVIFRSHFIFAYDSVFFNKCCFSVYGLILLVYL